MTDLTSSSNRRARVLLASLAACLLVGAVGASPALADFGVNSFDGSVTDQNGNAYTQAGGHPYAISTTITFNTHKDPTSPSITDPDGDVKDIHVLLPPGLVGNPQATPQCTEADFTDQGSALGLPACPVASQVGTASSTLSAFSNASFSGVYNLVPPAGVPAEFGFVIGSVKVHMLASVRPGPEYDIEFDVNDISQAAGLLATTLTFWGVPADSSHDPQRLCPNRSTGNIFGCSSGTPLTPFLTLPTSCLGPQTTTMEVDSWQDPGAWQTASFVSHDNYGTPVGATGCDRLEFSPSIAITPDSSAADSPSGLNVDLQVPQNQDPNGLAEANLKDTTVALPAGVSVSPSAANGLAACSPEQIGLENSNQPSCPDASKIGSVEVQSPLLPDPLTGGVYVAQQNNNPFNSLLAIYVTAYADGVWVKLAGHVVADPVTGQLTATFDNNPQLPFSDFKLNFFGGPRAALATPETCGTYTTNSSLTPWSGNSAVTTSDSFKISSGCVSKFSPSFTAGTQNAQAGAYSPFVLSFQRSDSDQDLSGLSVKLPPGMLAKLAGVQECSGAQLAQAAANTGAQEQASPSCPAGSQVGTVTTGAGPGSDPFYLGGKAYLTGPYKGAPYGLAVIVPAVAGPYDLGTVVVRQALYVDPTTAQVTAVSDPFPTILQGIPLRLRRVDVDLNRPDFIVNPTSCDVMSVTGTLSSTLGLSAPASSRFQVGGCAALKFSPKLQMKLTGKGRTKSGDHPNLISTLTQNSGQANIHNVKVALPLSLALDPNNSQHVCNYSVAQAVTTGPADCPASTQVGTATAITPLLSQPLTGPVYLVQGIRYQNGQPIHTLPSLLIPLRGQIALDLRAQTSVSRGKLVTTFPTIPDAAVSKFMLTINGGRKGILVVTGRGRTICGKHQITSATLAGQNGKAVYPNIKMSTPCRSPRKVNKHDSRHKH